MTRISAEVKNRLKFNFYVQSNLSPREARTEIHHDFPIYKGGNGDEENLVPCTLPQHAIAHLREAENATTIKDIGANYWSVSAIVRRMNNVERQEFNDMIKRRK